MPGLHPFDFMDHAPSELPPELREVAARSIGRLVAHIEQQGLRASVEQSLDIPAALWRSDPGNPPLSVLADPGLQHPVPADSVLAVVLYRNGVPVGCVAHRRIWVWNLVRDMETLNFWFPGHEAKPDGFRCVVRPGLLKGIGACWTIYSCCLYVRPDAQHPDMQAAMIRLSHALCTVHWYWSWLFGRARHAVAARMPYRIWGVDAVSSGVFLLGPQADGVERHPHYLAMISRQTLEEQLVHPDYGDPAKPIDIPPSLRVAPPVASLVREVAS